MAPAMLAYTIQTSSLQGYPPMLAVGMGSNTTWMKPDRPQDDSYWIVFISANNPRQKVGEFIVPGSNASTVPAGIDTYINNPAYIFAVATQYLNTLHVPQGAFYNFLTKYGAGRELQKLEQVNSVLGCGSYGRMSYILTSAAGGRSDPKVPPPASYEASNYTNTQINMMMSLMSLPDGNPPYSINDSYTFKT